MYVYVYIYIYIYIIAPKHVSSFLTPEPMTLYQTPGCHLWPSHRVLLAVEMWLAFPYTFDGDIYIYIYIYMRGRCRLSTR